MRYRLLGDYWLNAKLMSPVRSNLDVDYTVARCGYKVVLVFNANMRWCVFETQEENIWCIVDVNIKENLLIVVYY